MCAGLSPLARGTPTLCYPNIFHCRFIPAGAGNTGESLRRGSCGAVYPRWRGEHIDGLKEVQESAGLSPLARGTLSPHSSAAADTRFIPAGAGNTIQYPPAGLLTAVYPRWRGEHCRFSSGTEHPPGLSPLARGTRFSPRVQIFNGRFIPAGAGNTQFVLVSRCDLTVYPRWRGEHEYPPVLYSASCGLSPLARGTH